MMNPIEHISLNHSLMTNQIERKAVICPSLKIFQLPLNDMQIIDILNRKELRLPELSNKITICDPSLAQHVGRKLPQQVSSYTVMECRRPLFSEIRWRKRKMNIKRRRKYEKKMQFKFQTRKQNKEKRYQDLLNMITAINEKRTNIFNSKRFVKREIEKARFYGYRCSPIYNAYRIAITQGMKSFEEKYFRKFEDPHQPLHIKLEKELFEKKN